MKIKTLIPFVNSEGDIQYKSTTRKATAAEEYAVKNYTVIKNRYGLPPLIFKVGDGGKFKNERAS